MRRHPLSPSSSDRWMNCPAYYDMTRGLPPSPSSKYADEGTEAHGVLEMAIMLNAPPKLITANAEMAKGVQKVLDFTAGMVNLKPERRVRIPLRSLLMKGTADVTGVRKRTLHVIDFKYGAGVAVDAAKTAQPRLYAVGAREELGRFDEYQVTIVQPRAWNRRTLSSITLTNKELDVFVDRADEAVEKNLKGNAVPKAGAWCRFCPAKPTCKAAMRKAIENAFKD